VYCGVVTSVSNEYTTSFVMVSLVNLHVAARHHVPDDHLSSHRTVQKITAICSTVQVKVKQSRYRPGLAQRFPGS